MEITVRMVGEPTQSCKAYMYSTRTFSGLPNNIRLFIRYSNQGRSYMRKVSAMSMHHLSSNDNR
jgi:hypothetical protein